MQTRITAIWRALRGSGGVSAAPGDIIQIYGTGFETLTGTSRECSPNFSPARLTNPVSVTIGGVASRRRISNMRPGMMRPDSTN
jgi:uncharacterized protein (TIGR03437 family)